MRFKHMLAAGLMLTLPLLLTGTRVEADGPLLSKLHHHGDCKVESSVVRLPAQEIRVETSAPRIVVNEGLRSSARVRGFFPAQPVVGVPMVAAPIVGHFMPVQLHSGVSFGHTTQVSAGSSALEAVHALERQHLEFSKHKAALNAEMEHVNKTMQRVQGHLSTSLQASASGSSADLSTVIDKLGQLSDRMSAVEKLLIIHDHILKEKK